MNTFPEPVYQATPGYNYQTMPFLEVSAHNPQHLKVSNNPQTPYMSTSHAQSTQVMKGVQMMRMPLIAAGYNTLTGDNRCSNQSIDADYYSLKTAYEF